MDKKLQVFAVFRIHEETAPFDADHVAVKEILPRLDEAEREVERLNRLNSVKGCRYFWQATRFFPNGRKAISREQTKLKLVK